MGEMTPRTRTPFLPELRLKAIRQGRASDEKHPIARIARELGFTALRLCTTQGAGTRRDRCWRAYPFLSHMAKVQPEGAFPEVRPFHSIVLMRKARAKPRVVKSPTCLPPYLNASGIIVSASMVKRAPPAKDWTKATVAAEAPSKRA